MKIFAVSDIHSFYTPLITALEEAGFNQNDENHLLVVCGDCFDRGPESKQMLRFLYDTKNKIVIRGNHEELFDDCCSAGYPSIVDYYNGTYDTICDIGNMNLDRSFAECCEISYKSTRNLFNKMVNYFETEHYVFVHAWVPTMPEWREAPERRWKIARWGDPFVSANHGGNTTGKIIVHGHRSNKYYWDTCPDKTDNCYDIAYHDNCISGIL